MHKLYDLKEMLTKELETFGTRDKIDVGSLDIIDKLAHSIKDICKIIETSEGGNSRDGSYDGDGSYRRSMRSYDESMDGMRSRDWNYSGRRRDAMGRYSGAERDMDGLVSELREMMPDLPEEKKREVQRFVQKIEQM